MADKRQIEEQNTECMDMAAAECEIETADETAAASCPHCGHRKKKRSDKEYRDLCNRLSRIEGQIRGIRRMLDEDAYCPDILLQCTAANSALNSFCKVLLASHLKTCVVHDIQEGNEETIDELLKVMQKLMK